VIVKYLFPKCYETVSPTGIILGSASSWFPRGFTRRYLPDQVRDCVDPGMADARRQPIFGGNAAC